MKKFYNIDGIMSDEKTDKSIVLECSNQFSIFAKDNTSELDLKLISLTHKVAEILFGSVQNLYNLPLTIAHSYGGVDAEIKVSKQEFEKWVNSQKSDVTHKILFYYDFQNLVGSLQNLISESRFLFCDFYKTLNINSFMLSSNPMNQDILMFASGQLVTNIFSKINHLFINLASQLDFLTKITFELENLPKDFLEYPKLKSNKILYGDFKRIKSLTFDNTLFDKTDDIKLIICLRNEIIHNASFENIPKVYQQFKQNKMVEKFIYVPDFTNGNFDTFKNRNRFFNNEVKLNEILPKLITDFWSKMETTIDKIK
ncbi:hypothetical protein PGK76_008280 [Riemerella anatipestifer]|uniref:hypothetical protein n=1 Tax=Riemerella anatipestifer TaxID=34085 RepID=UPI00296B924B|nr:hypothetical protein [Riemerella anatipestifer]